MRQGEPARLRTPFRRNHGKITMLVYCEPLDCTGKCLYCFSVDGITKSTGANQDTLLGRDCEWDPAAQLSRRMDWYGLQRGSGVKYDIAIKGDSFANKDPRYLERFVKDIYDFFNGTPSDCLEEAKERQEVGPDRCVTVKVETRPDHISETTCELMLRLGVTTVEIGVQSLDEEVLRINRRGHGVEAVREATDLIRRSGFELGYHMMVGMPGSSLDLDYRTLSETLWRGEYSPDVLKLYPTILYHDMPTQKDLADTLARGEWRPLSEEEYERMLDSCLPKIPRYVHINRIQRMSEINSVAAGPAKVIDRTRFNGICECLWQRSPAQTGIDLDGDYREFSLRTTRQGNSGYCVEGLDRDGRLLAYSRMSVFEDGVARIRDLRVLGDMALVGRAKARDSGIQHIGIGKAMLQRLEELSFEEGCRRVVVHPAPGVRRYFVARHYLPSEKRAELGYYEKGLEEERR
jgi:elongator complex protein 3